VIEDEQTCMTVASHMVEVCARLGLAYVFKASFDKANRTSVDSFRGPGLDAGLEILAAVAARFRVPVVTDVHETAQVAKVASVVDVLQIPAFLCRQTDLLLAAAESGRVVNVKKGQFLAPEDMAAVVAKVRSTGNQRLLLTERGTSFGYHNLVVDMRGLVTMRELGTPVVFDATHSVQLPGGQGTSSGGRREFVPPLARAAAAVGIDGLFLETHPNPSEARSDGPNSLPLQDVEQVLRKVRDIHELGR
jgi:2-dehydro-3-deoxyphosphooctonate aldolase (KDO 8-P synthase)